MYKYFNNNPLGLVTGDCVVRGLSKLLNQTWDKTYTDLCLTGYSKCMMPSANAVHIQYLKEHGYEMYTLPSNCPSCITVKEFSQKFPNSEYLLATGDHVVALVFGDYYDSFDSGAEIITYYFKKKGD